MLIFFFAFLLLRKWLSSQVPELWRLSLTLFQGHPTFLQLSEWAYQIVYVKEFYCFRGGVKGWGEKAYNCNWITIKIFLKFYCFKYCKIHHVNATLVILWHSARLRISAQKHLHFPPHFASYNAKWTWKEAMEKQRPSLWNYWKICWRNLGTDKSCIWGPHCPLLVLW